MAEIKLVNVVIPKSQLRVKLAWNIEINKLNKTGGKIPKLKMQ